MDQYNTLIIGAGAAGCLSAIKLKEDNINCAIIESNDRILKKLLVTGNGRCNLTNEKIVSNFDKYYSSLGNTNLSAFEKYNYNHSIFELENLGILTTTLEDKKVYPRNLQASSVVDLFRIKLEELSVPIFYSNKVKDISYKNKEFQVVTNQGLFKSKNLIIATGGMAMPSTGSDGSMYKILKNLGLEIFKALPALVQIKLESKNLRALSGVKFDGVAGLFSNGEEIASEFGEILFTDYGISGPPILQLSRFSSPLLDERKELTLKLNLFPDMEENELEELVINRYKKFKIRPISELLNGIINKKLIPIIFKDSGVIKMTDMTSDIDMEVIFRIINKLQSWEFKIIGDNGFANAQSTLGGVSIDEVNPITMESKKYTGMYLIGELMDVCGACGGYNLQWAWTSALAASSEIKLHEKQKEK